MKIKSNKRLGVGRISRIAVVLATVALLSLGVWQPASATMTIRLPHCCAVDSHFDVGAKEFAKLLKDKTNGEIEVKVFPGGQLGQETEVIQNVQGGTIEMTMIGHDPLAQFAPETTILSLPYLFDSHEQAFKLLDGQFGDIIDAALLKKNLLVLGWGDNGARIYTDSKRPLEKPEDFKGLKFRSPQNPVNLAVTKALGGIAVAIPYGEVYTAIQQGTIDGQENAIINVYPAKLYEVQKYMSMTHHLLSFTVFVMNKDFFNSLSPENQKAVKEAAQEAMEFQRGYSKKLSAELVGKMKEKGVAVTWPDLAPFKKATRPIHEEYIGNKFPKELYDMVQQGK